MPKRFQLRIRRDGVRYSYGFHPSEEARDFARAEIEDRLNREEMDGHIIGSQGEVLKTYFEQNGRKFEIVGSQKTGNGKFEVIDFVKDREKNEIREISRKKLFNLTRNNG